MGKAHKKTGKGRLDKYYKLAKEQGYRARSAFKLIQLNKKYSILGSSKCTLDLCAAPGGWLQVASKYMPVNSIIVGVDLVPIKPIPRVVTFTADITTPQCRNLIRNELKDWKADVVLHDGAPNVGTAWIQDAFSQSELVLTSLKLAVEFLAKGGTFVTKVFRSVDYNNLIWVFNQLFAKVEATKPPSSRNVSAEIFVVCKEFLAPKFIDPKFLDPRHVFKDLSTTIEEVQVDTDKAQANVFHPEKKRRHREGYADGDYTLFKSLPASAFILGCDPVSALGGHNKITFLTNEEKGWLSFDITTGDVKANCEDLKVLGKGDFKTLIKWRLALREQLGLDVKTKDTDDSTEQVEIVDEEQDISDELERMNAEAAARAKRERRRANEIKTRTIQRMQLQMTAPMDIGLEQQDLALVRGQSDIFELDTEVQRLHKKLVADEDDGGMSGDEAVQEEDYHHEDAMDSGEEQEENVALLEAELDGMYKAYQGRLQDRDAKYRVRKAREKDAQRKVWHGIKPQDSDEDSEEGEDGGRYKLHTAKMWSDDGSSSDGSSTGYEGEERAQTSKRRVHHAQEPDAREKKRPRISEPSHNTRSVSGATALWFSQDVFRRIEGLDDKEGDNEWEDYLTSNGHVDEDDQGDDFQVVPQGESDTADLWDGNDMELDEMRRPPIRDFALTTPEAITIAQHLVNREKSKTQLINDGFNRYTLNSKEGLPSWFRDDESKHYKPNIPVTKEAVAILRAKQRALDARPIKKVAEAKARKKLKAAQKLEKAMKKAEGVNATSDMSEREKAQAIDRLLRRGLSGKKTRKEVKVVVAKGVHKGVKGRPRGVKGRYVMVDSRLRKELRAHKRKEKANKRRR